MWTFMFNFAGKLVIVSDGNNLCEICDTMYEVTTQFFPQSLTFYMAEESVAREDVATLRTKYDTGRDLFTLEALAAPSTFFEISSSPTSSFFLYISSQGTRTSENWCSSRTIRSILLMKLLKILQFYLHFAPIWVRRRSIADVPVSHWTDRRTAANGN